MSNCINNKCQLCRNLVISTAVTVVTVDGTDTLVIDIPAHTVTNNSKIVENIKQNTATEFSVAVLLIGINNPTVQVRNMGFVTIKIYPFPCARLRSYFRLP